MSGVKRIRLHLGAHRTATTRLQSLLDHNAERLAQAGIAAFTPPRAGRRDVSTIRELFDPELFERARRSRRAGLLRVNDLLWLGRRKTAMRRFLAQPGATQVVLSEENLIPEDAVELLTGALYSHVRRRLKAVRRMLPVAPEYIAIATRDYASFHESFYAEIAKYRVLPAEDEVRYSVLARIQSQRCGWQHVVAAVHSAFPRADLEVWRHDHYDEGRRLRALIGRDDLELELPPGHPNASPGREAIRRLQEARAAGPLSHTEADRIVESASAAGDERVLFFTSEERALLATAYERDLRAIAESGVHVR